jgi:hypothetical protein
MFIDMGFVGKTIDAIELTKVPLVVLALVFKCNVRIQAQKWWKERVRAISCRQLNWR